MQIPEYVAKCIRALEDAGYAAWLVGGCVRDDLMGIAPHDYDICTAALPEQTQAVFCNVPQNLDGIRHGTVKLELPEEEIEITTFRREGAYQDNRHPGWVEFVSDVADDLARRDYTVNAIAWSPTRGYADPFGGREDLKNGILRVVGDPETRYREDSLRILRGMRFSARFRFRVERGTLAAMTALAPLTDNLARERVFEELSSFLLHADAEDLIRFSPVLAQIIPELGAEVGFEQHSPHHAFDVYTHTAWVVHAVAKEPVLRWAALLHDIGKVPCFSQDSSGRGHFHGHAAAGAQMADSVLIRLRAPKDLREQVVWLIERHMTKLKEDRIVLRSWLSECGMERLQQLLALQEADMRSKGTSEHLGSLQFSELRTALDDLYAAEGRITARSLAVGGTDLAALGFRGKAIGECLSRLLMRVLQEQLPNEKEALLTAAQEELLR